MHKSSNDEGEIAFAPWPHHVRMYIRMYVCLYPVSAGWKVGLFSTGTGESPRTESLQLLNPTLIVHTYVHTYIRTHVLHYSTPHTTVHNKRYHPPTRTPTL